MSTFMCGIISCTLITLLIIWPLINFQEIAEFCAKWSNETRHQLEKRIENLNSNAKSTEALKLFPSNIKSKFSGIKNDGPSLSEFLFNINYAQERLNLSEKEFKMKLLTSLTGPAHEDIRHLVEQGDTVTSIYHNLASMYDSTPEPNKAKHDLFKFKIPRRWDLYKAQNHFALF